MEFRRVLFRLLWRLFAGGASPAHPLFLGVLCPRQRNLCQNPFRPTKPPPPRTPKGSPTSAAPPPLPCGTRGGLPPTTGRLRTGACGAESRSTTTSACTRRASAATEDAEPGKVCLLPDAVFHR